MLLTKTDHHEQALRMDKETKFLVREAFASMLDNQYGSVEMRDRALKLKRMLEDPATEDKPAIFQKSHGNMINCTDCLGTGNEKLYSLDRDEEPTYITCKTCKGEGQLYIEVIRKMYVPTEYHRRKLAK